MLKKIIGFMLIILFLTSTGNNVFSAESVVQTAASFGGSLFSLNYPPIKTLTITCTSAADGSLTETSVDPGFMEELKEGGYCLFSIEAYPGGTGPTDDSDIVLNNSHDFNIAGNAGLNLLDNATNGRAQPTIGSVPVLIPITDDLTFDVTGNVVNSATFVIVITFVLKP